MRASPDSAYPFLSSQKMVPPGYLDIRRNPIKDAILLRNKVTRLVRERLVLATSSAVETFRLGSFFARSLES